MVAHHSDNKEQAAAAPEHEGKNGEHNSGSHPHSRFHLFPHHSHPHQDTPSASVTLSRPPNFSGMTQRDIHITEGGVRESPASPHEPTRIAVWRPIPERTTIKPDPPPTQAEQKAIQELKEFTERELVLTPEDEDYEEYAKWEKRFLDKPDTYLRYIRASDGKVAEAKLRLEETLNWRREYRPDLIKPSEIAHEAEGGKVVVNGFDKSGRPIVWLRPSKENTKPSPLQVRHLIFQLERAIDLMPEGVTKLALVVDYHGTSSSQNPPKDTVKQVIHILQHHYCERLGRAIVMNVPWYLSAFFSFVKPLLDPKTKEKIKFNPELADLVPSQQLDEEFGGDYNYVYDSRVYLPAICHFCGIKEDGTREDVIPKDRPEERPEALQRQLTAEKLQEDEADVAKPSAIVASPAAEKPNPTESPAKESPSKHGRKYSKDPHRQGSIPVKVNDSDDADALNPPSLVGQSQAKAETLHTSHKADGAASSSRSNGKEQKAKRKSGAFAKDRGLDAEGKPLVHKHKHLFKAFCMHKGAVDPRSAKAEKVSAAPAEQSPSNPSSADTLPAEPSKGKIRIADGANESKPYNNAPLPTNATFGTDAYMTALEDPADAHTDYFAAARHKAIPVSDHEDHGEAILDRQEIMKNLHTGKTQDDLTIAYKVLKPPAEPEPESRAQAELEANKN